MTDYGNTKALALLKQAVDISAHGEAWHHKMMLWAQSHGLQGHKRLHRHESQEGRDQYIRIQNYAIDMFGETLEPSWDYDIPSPADIPAYLEAYLDWENSVYTRLASISNDLTVEGFPCEAALVSEGLPRKELERVRRMITEYGLSGWDMTYILLRDRELHDKMKAILSES
jgi:hypothetical protein